MNKNLAADLDVSNVTEVANDIHQELVMAMQADQAAVLYVLYGIQQDKEDAKKALRLLVEAEGLQPTPFSFEVYYDHVSKGLPCFTNSQIAVCVDVSKLGKGKSNISSLVGVLAANKHQIIQNKVKLVVWMTCEEAIEFSRTSPDLWIFRHRMFDLNLNYCAIPMDQEDTGIDPTNKLAGGFEQLGEGLINMADTNSSHLKDPVVQRLLTNVTMALIQHNIEQAEELVLEGIKLASELEDLELEQLFDRALHFIKNEKSGVEQPVITNARSTNSNMNTENERTVIANCDANLKKGDRYAAIKILTDHLETAVGADAIWEKLGDVYAGYGVFDKAVEAYERISCACVDLQTVALKKADCLVQGGHAEKAIDIYKTALRSATGESTIVALWKKVGDAYTKLNKHEEAIAAYSYADHRDLDSTRPMRSLGARRSGVNSPNLTAEMWNEIGNIFSKTGDDQEAAIAYQKSIELNATNGYAYVNLAKVLSRQGDHGGAEQTIRTGIKSARDKTQIYTLWNLLGDEFRETGKYGEAMTAYRNADLIKTGSRVLVPFTNYSNFSATARF